MRIFFLPFRASLLLMLPVATVLWVCDGSPVPEDPLPILEPDLAQED